jgi:acetylornithine deacetylase/succinyl-diaminopimelate desuccinylase-like protein
MPKAPTLARWRTIGDVGPDAELAPTGGPAAEGGPPTTGRSHVQGELAAEATELLRRLVRLNTVNPPGAERDAIESLRSILTEAGFQCELLAAEPNRPNLVARLRGENDGPTLCYLGHLDTVLADAGEWKHDPWSGDIADGYLWGRGSLDMKSQVAAEVAAVAGLARGGWRPACGELLLVTVVDEETGGELGSKWLCETHAEKVRCDMLLNEGGGAHFELHGRRYYGVCCAEKGVFRFTVTTTGAAGHASMPRLGENALLKMAPVLERFANGRPSLEPTVEPLAFLRGVGEDEHDPSAALERLDEQDSRLLTMLEPMFGVTFAPTKISASEKINVIPSKAQLRVDCRVPPGFGEPQARHAIEQVLGGLDGLQIEFTERVTGNRSPIDSPLMDALGQWIAQRDPGARTVPMAMPGFTDSHRFRAAFPECVAYGFFPQRHQSLLQTQALMHAPDERIDVRDLAFAAEFYRDLAVGLLG